MKGTRGPNHIYTKLCRIAEKARRYVSEAITTLAHEMDVHFLYEAYRRTRKDGAVGVDGQTGKDYEENLEENLKDLHERIKGGTYRAPPVRRTYIPKEGEEKGRPIGVPTFERKVVERAIVMVLNEIYEQEFFDFSYAFRPGRSQHQAVEYLWKNVMDMRGGYILSVDIKGYFDSIPHEKLKECLNKRVGDGVIKRLIGKLLKAGIMEDGNLEKQEYGAPQGGVLSPLISNVYLHEVVDRWFVETVKPRMNGKAFMVRFADDIIMGFELEGDAERVRSSLEKRLGRYGLILHPEKTKMIDFRRPPYQSGRKIPEERRKTYDFLGFTFYWGRSRKGYWVVRHKTIAKRLTRSLKRIWEVCRKMRHRKVREQREILASILRGHYGYYGVTGNGKAVTQFFEGVKKAWQYWLNRRSQRRSMPWVRFGRLIRAHPLPIPQLPKSVYAEP